MKIILRIVMLPFVFSLVLIAYNIAVIKNIFDYMRYGGEWLTFDKNSKNTIRDIFNKVEDKL